MTATPRTDIPLVALPYGARTLTPHVVFDLGDALVALRFATERTAAHTLACTITAWQVEPDGSATPVDDADGVVLVEHVHNASPERLAVCSVTAIAMAMRDLVLGEPPADPPLIAWSEDLRAQASIRNAIAVARASADGFDLTGG